MSAELYRSSNGPRVLLEAQITVAGGRVIGYTRSVSDSSPSVRKSGMTKLHNDLMALYPEWRRIEINVEGT